LTAYGNLDNHVYEEVPMAKRYSPKFKFQVVMELLQGEKSAAQVAKAYGVHPNTVNNWKQKLLYDGAEVYAKDCALA